MTDPTLRQHKAHLRGDACGLPLVLFHEETQKWYTVFCSLHWDHEGKHEVRIVW